MNTTTQIVLLNSFHLNGHTVGFYPHFKVRTTFHSQHKGFKCQPPVSGNFFFQWVFLRCSASLRHWGMCQSHEPRHQKRFGQPWARKHVLGRLGHGVKSLKGDRWTCTGALWRESWQNRHVDSRNTHSQSLWEQPPGVQWWGIVLTIINASFLFKEKEKRDTG